MNSLDIIKYRDCYEKHKNLKLAAKELDIPWQNLYYNLRKFNIPVTGDKHRYGSDTDRFASYAEKLFLDLVPFAEDLNEKKFQSKCDFKIGNVFIDIKASKPTKSKTGIVSWCFSIKKQEVLADFFVMMAFDEKRELQDLYLVPSEICKNYSTIRISNKNKWTDFKVNADELRKFFKNYSNE